MGVEGFCFFCVVLLSSTLLWSLFPRFGAKFILIKRIRSLAVQLFRPLCMACFVRITQ